MISFRIIRMRGQDFDDTEPRPSAGQYLAAAVGFAAGWLVLGWPWLSGRVTIPWDAKAHFQPQIQFLADSIARGDSPFWNPFVFSGHPQIADPQSMIFSPPFLLLAALNPSPGLWAVDATVLGAILVGGLFLMAWMRDQGWHPVGALVAALAFGFGAAMAWRIQHTGQVMSLALLPPVLFLLDRALLRGGVLYGLGAGVLAGFLVLGRDQVALFCVYLLAAFAAWRLCSSGGIASAARRASLPMLAGGVGGLAVIAIPVLLTALVAGQSNRPAIDLEGAGRGSFHPALALTLFVPDLFGASGRMWDYWGPPSYAWNTTGLFIAQNVGQLYIGAVPALLLLIGAFSGVLWHREIRFFSLALLATAIYALGWYTPIFGLMHAYLPGVGLFRRPADAVFLFGFLGAVMAGYVTHRLLATETPIPRRQLRPAVLGAGAITIVALLAAFGLAVHMDRLETAGRALILSGLAFAVAGAILADAVWFNPIRPILGGLLLAGFTVVDLAWFNGPSSSSALPPSHFDALEPKSKNETLVLLKRKIAEGTAANPERRDRVELVGLGFHWPNATITHRLEHTLGYNPVRLGLYAEATGAEDTVGLPEQRKFSKLFPGYGSKLADLIGLRYVVSKLAIEDIDKTIRPGDLELIGQTADGFIYENPRALPRVMFAASAQPADFDEILKSGVWPDVDFASTVLLSGYDEKVAGLVANRGSGIARLVRYANTRVDIEVESTRGGYVVLNDVWHPWWVARVDGERVPLLRANVLFRAVRVSPGRHTVTVTFEPIREALASVMSRR
jgi:hypothetical protein